MIATTLSPGLVIRDTYTVVRHLGSGAFGDVYLARHRYMGLQAMKIFLRSDGTDALEEAYLLTKLSHHNIVRMFEANDFEFGGQSLGYFSMEYVEGGTLLRAFDFNLPFEQRVTLGKDILSGLAFAHSQSPPVIHRDISPSNVLLERSSQCFRCKISDFGLAKHVDSKSLMASAAGKYLYMAPESFLGTHSTATDVYSAGIVIFELFTGCHPFRVKLSESATAAEIASVVRRSREQAIPNVHEVCDKVDERWDEFFQATLMHDAESRPVTARDALRMYAAIADFQEPVNAAAEIDVDEFVSRAKELSLQAGTLDEAISMLERACASNSHARAKYSELLSLWKRGIVL